MNEIQKAELEVGSREPVRMPGQMDDLPEEFEQMAMTPEAFKKRRIALLQFIHHQLEEAEYDRRGYIVKVNDYYKVPGSEKLALSKRGAEGLSGLYQYKILHMVEVNAFVTKEFTSATYRCTLHRANVVVAECESSCNTAEKGFRSHKVFKGRYASDYRAAENDVRARAQKRAFVNAIIHACGAADILEVADEGGFEHIPKGEFEEVTVGKLTKSECNGGPSVEKVKRFLQLVGNPAFTDEDREKATSWVNSSKCTPERLDDQITRAEEKIEAHGELPI